MTQREPRQRNPGYLAFVRLQPCCVCHRAAPSEAAHIRMASPEHGKRATGMAEKASDRWCLALCARHHRTGPQAQHAMGEAEFWRMHGLDPFEIAIALFAKFGSPDSAPRAGRAKKRPANPALRNPRKIDAPRLSSLARATLAKGNRPIQNRPFPKVSRPFRSARP